MQVDTLEQAALERANSGAHIAIQELQQQLNQANHLLVERQSQWEHSGAERGARILTLERQLAHVRRPPPPPKPCIARDHLRTARRPMLLCSGGPGV